MKKLTVVFTPLLVPLTLGILAFSLSTHWARLDVQRAAPIVPEIWNAVLKDRGYMPDRRNSGPLLATELPDAEVWIWPQEKQLQIGNWIFRHKSWAKNHLTQSPPQSLGIGWPALIQWMQLSAAQPLSAPHREDTQARERIWY